MLTESNEHSEDEDADCALRRGFGDLLSQYIKHSQVLWDVVWRSMIHVFLTCPNPSSCELWKWSKTLGGNLICTNGVISKTVSNMRGAYHWLGQSALTTNGGWLKSKLNISLNKLNIKQTIKARLHVDGLWHNLMILSKWEIGQKQFCYAKKDESHSTLFEQWWLQLWTLPL